MVHFVFRHFVENQNWAFIWNCKKYIYVKLFTVTFDLFNASLLNKSINDLITLNFWTIVYFFNTFFNQFHDVFNIIYLYYIKQFILNVQEYKGV